MKYKSIKTEIEYKEAVKYLEDLGDNPNFENNSDMQKEFEQLEKMIELYDKEHYTIENGNPIEIIKLKMAYMELKQKDLIIAIGSKGLVSDVLNKKRKLSKKMIRELSKLLNINQEILNTEYDLIIPKTIKKIERKLDNDKIFNFPKALRTQIDNYSNYVLGRGAIIHVLSV